MNRLVRPSRTEKVSWLCSGTASTLFVLASTAVTRRCVITPTTLASRPPCVLLNDNCTNTHWLNSYIMHLMWRLVYKAVTRNLFGGGVFSHFFCPFLFTILFPFSPPPPRMAPQIQLIRELGERCELPSAGRPTFADTRPQAQFCVFRAQKTCLLAAIVHVFMLNEIRKLKQMWSLLNVLYVTICCNTQSTPLVTVSICSVQ